MKKILTNKIAIKMLNESGVPESDHPEYDGRVPQNMVNRYGEWLHENDKIGFYCAKRDLEEIHQN